MPWWSRPGFHAHLLQVWGHGWWAAERHLWECGGTDPVHCRAAQGPLHGGGHQSDRVHPLQPPPRPGYGAPCICGVLDGGGHGEGAAMQAGRGAPPSCLLGQGSSNAVPPACPSRSSWPAFASRCQAPPLAPWASQSTQPSPSPPPHSFPRHVLPVWRTAFPAAALLAAGQQGGLGAHDGDTVMWTEVGRDPMQCVHRPHP